MKTMKVVATQSICSVSLAYFIADFSVILKTV